MAELHVEKKRKSNTLWIVIGVALLALLAWAATRGNNNENRNTTTPGATTTGSLSVIDATVLAVLTPSTRSNFMPAASV